MYEWSIGSTILLMRPALQPATSARTASEDNSLPLNGDSDQVARLQALGLARIEGENCVFTDPELLQGFSSLSESEFTVGQLIDIHERIHSAVDGIARDMISTAKKHFVDQHGEGCLPGEDEVGATADMLMKMRSLTVHSVTATLARTLDDNLERELGDYLTASVQNRTDPGTRP